MGSSFKKPVHLVGINLCGDFAMNNVDYSCALLDLA